jgi:hypothetical protein
MIAKLYTEVSQANVPPTRFQPTDDRVYVHIFPLADNASGLRSPSAEDMQLNIETCR